MYLPIDLMAMSYVKIIIQPYRFNSILPYCVPIGLLYIDNYLVPISSH